MNYFLVIFLVFEYIFIYYTNNKNYFSVSLLTNLMFIISSLVFLGLNDFFDHEISFYTIYIITISIMFLYLGEKLSEINVFSTNKANLTNIISETYVFEFSKKIVVIVFFIGLCNSIYNFYCMYNYSLTLGNTGNILLVNSYMRKAILDENEIYKPSNIVLYLGVLNQAFSYYYLFIFFYNKVFNNKTNCILLLPVASTALFLVTSTERVGFIKIIVQCVAIYAIITYHHEPFKFRDVSKKIIKLIIVLAFTFVTVFFLLGLAMEKASIDSWQDTLGTYVGSSIMGLDLYLKRPWNSSYLWGQQTFYNLYKLLSLIGANINLSSSFQQSFYWKNGYANIYTSLMKPIEDFGVFGMLFTRVLIGFFYGVFSKYIFNLSSIKDRFITIIVYGMFFYPVVLSATSDLYLFFFQLEYVYIVILLFLIKRFKSMCP